MTTEQDKVNAAIEDRNGPCCQVDRLSLVDSWIVAAWGDLRRQYAEHGDISHMPVVLTDEQMRDLHLRVATDMTALAIHDPQPNLHDVIDVVLAEFEIDCWRGRSTNEGDD